MFAREELHQNPPTYLKHQTRARPWSFRAGLRLAKVEELPTDIETWNFDSVEQTGDVL